MKLSPKPTIPRPEGAFSSASATAPGVNLPGLSAATVDSRAYRRLKGNEMVSRGDFVEHESRGFEPWEGPGGFRADAFVKPIYRRHLSRSIVGRK